MPPNRQPDDEDTQEHAPAPGYPAAPYHPPAQAPPANTEGRPAPSAPSWSSQQQWPSQPQPPQEPQWQQPQEPQWQQPQQWQQPPPQWGGQQGWGQSGYWVPTPQYSNNPLVIVAGIILIVFGILVTLVGLVGLLAGAFASAVLDEIVTPDVALPFDLAALSTVLLVVFGIVLLIGIFHLLSGMGIFLHKGWARLIGAVLAVLGTLAGVLAVVAALEVRRPETGDLVVALVIAVGYGLTLFSLIAGGNHFRRRHPG